MAEGLGPGSGQVKSGQVPAGSGPSAPVSQPRVAPSKRLCAFYFPPNPAHPYDTGRREGLVKRAKVPPLGSAQHPPPMSITCSKDEQQVNSSPVSGAQKLKDPEI